MTPFEHLSDASTERPFFQQPLALGQTSDPVSRTMRWSNSWLCLLPLVLHQVAAQQIVFDDSAALVKMGGVIVLSYDPSTPTILSLHLPIRSLATLPAFGSGDAQLWLDGTAPDLSLMSASASGSTPLTLSRNVGQQKLTLSGRLQLGDGVANCPVVALQPTGTGATAPSESTAKVFELAPNSGDASILFGSDTSTAPALVKLASDSTYLYMVGTLDFTGADSATHSAECFTLPPPSPPPSPTPPPSPPPPSPPPVTYDGFYLVIAGGGAGRENEHGKGGAGGMLSNYGGTALTFSPSHVLTVTVGAGATYAWGNTFPGGGASSISGHQIAVDTSGGGGGGHGAFCDAYDGANGGSGGGGGDSDDCDYGEGGSGVSGQGHQGIGGAGGNGGGGAGGPAVGQSGGPGRANSITGSSVTYAAGGGSSGPYGGGAYSAASGRDGGGGGVVLRFATASYSGVTSGGPAVSTVGADTVLIFTASGSYQM